jgi:acetyl esterase/lipase
MLRSLIARRVVLAGAVLLAACDAPVDTTPVSPAALEPQQALASMDDVGSSTPSATALPAPNFLNQAYATRSQAQRLDVYLPTTGTGPFPVVMWIHGGGWRSGDKSMSTHPAPLDLLKHGIALVSINYRLSGEAKHPAQIQDVKAAIRYLRANATRFRINPLRIGTWGASAGGHLAVLAATSVGVSALTDLSLGNGTQSEAVSAAVTLFGPMSFLQMDPQLKAQGCPPYNRFGHAHFTSPPSQLLGAPIGTVPAKVHQADPITWITTGDPAVMIQHGTKDCAVPYGQSTGLRAALLQKLPANKVSYELKSGWTHADSRFYSVSNTLAVINFFKAWL